jgi:Ala-tRNA(Pro) deacylase
MSLPKQLENYMQSGGLHYKSIHHDKTPTALANVPKIACSPMDMAKVIAFRVDGQYALFVLPSNERIHMPSLKAHLGAIKVEMLNEYELNLIFSEFELGAQPPFGSMYNIPTYLSSHFGSHYSLFFNAGTHTDVVQMPIDEYKHFENPYILDFSIPYQEYEYYAESYLKMH